MESVKTFQHGFSTTKETGKPGCNPGRAQRAGGRSSHVQSGTKVSTPVQHGRTSRSVAHGRRILLGIFQLLRRLPGGMVLVQTWRNLPKRVAPNVIRGCRRQQETVRESIQLRETKPTAIKVGRGPMCPPAWRGSMLFQSPMGTDETFIREFSTTKNSKPPIVFNFMRFPASHVSRYQSRTAAHC